MSCETLFYAGSSFKLTEFLTLRMMRLSSQVREGHLVNALAYRGDERRDTLR